MVVVLFALGGALVVMGTAMLSLPAAVIVAGVLLLAVAVDLTRGEQ